MEKRQKRDKGEEHPVTRPPIVKLLICFTGKNVYPSMVKAGRNHPSRASQSLSLKSSPPCTITDDVAVDDTCLRHVTRLRATLTVAAHTPVSTFHRRRLVSRDPEQRVLSSNLSPPKRNGGGNAIVCFFVCLLFVCLFQRQGRGRK